MTDSNNADAVEPYDYDSDPSGLTQAEALGPDWLLDAIIDFSVGRDEEFAPGAISVTFTVKGALVTGTLISRLAWVKDQVASLPPQAKNLGEFIDALTDGVWKNELDRKAKREAENRPSRAREFIHMRDVTVHAGDAHFTLPYYRLRIESVDGWTIGTVS